MAATDSSVAARIGLSAFCHDAVLSLWTRFFVAPAKLGSARALRGLQPKQPNPEQGIRKTRTDLTETESIANR